MLIDRLKLPDDLRTLTKEELEEVAKETREKMIDVTSHVGGASVIEPGVC